jgi:hypothetical protein
MAGSGPKWDACSDLESASDACDVIARRTGRAADYENFSARCAGCSFIIENRSKPSVMRWSDQTMPSYVGRSYSSFSPFATIYQRTLGGKYGFSKLTSVTNRQGIRFPQIGRNLECRRAEALLPTNPRSAPTAATHPTPTPRKKSRTGPAQTTRMPVIVTDDPSELK